MKPRPLALKILDWLSVILLAIGTYLTIWWAPQEAVMGDVQRVFYFHVAAGWVGMIGFLLAVFSAIMYLVKKIIVILIVGHLLLKNRFLYFDLAFVAISSFC